MERGGITLGQKSDSLQIGLRLLTGISIVGAAVCGLLLFASAPFV